MILLAIACSCAPPPPACAAYQQASIVFVGKATQIEIGGGGSQQVTFSVSDKLKGPVETTEIIDGGGMCNTVFTKGKTYVVYATGTRGSWSSSLCGRTTTLDKAREDLAYARSLPKRTFGIVEGSVVVDDSSRTPRAGIEVRARDTRHRTRTDKAGRYKLELPPGQYTIDVVDPKTLAQTETIAIADKHTCEARDLLVAWNGRVRGRVVGVDGKPVANVQLTLVAERAGNHFATSDANGAYEFTRIPAGEYKVVAYSARNVPTTTTSSAIKLSQAGTVKIDVKLLP